MQTVCANESGVKEKGRARDANRRVGWSTQGLREGAAASGDARANLGGHPAPRPPGDRHRHDRAVLVSVHTLIAKGWNNVFAVSVFLLGNHLPTVTFARWLRDTKVLHDKDTVRQAIERLNRFQRSSFPPGYMYWELQAQANQPLSGVPSTVTADGFWQPDIEMLVNMPLASALFVAPDPPRSQPLTAN